MAVKIAENINLLNETGINLMELKKVLLQNKNNPLIHSGLLSSIKEEDYEKQVYEALTNDSVNEDAFQVVLISWTPYTNMEQLKKVFSDFQSKLSKALEAKGQKYFTTESSARDGGVVVIKKFGVNLNFIQREFRLPTREAKKLLKEGFIETYAKLKLNAIVKDMVEQVENKFKMEECIQLEVSPFYYDENREIYNVDFRILLVLTEKQLRADYIYVKKLSKDLDEILTFVQKEYYKYINGGIK
ncbi:hypothetical protein PP175_28020 (plasmid) [Aneurinibacillus sp. Ricciae_BoGa-3]|uniref:hypothetical protein n=1 Tax=Aneurinibacillus sp. Ricciae_BoGa-3 TaxID=3022697 RepID=UPI0023410EAA|nr:hypothetical protein [Aneurinibacillus sp. Ricciae_BoGa-3]WCK57039.1 hypothetical protein PP175_28020 [Aneurinibacillus sp. Ricciae_BoGa-3]